MKKDAADCHSLQPLFAAQQHALRCEKLPRTLCWVLWLRVGEVSGLRMLDVSLPLLMQFWNSKTGEEGWPSRPLPPWADGFQEALLQWAEAKGCERATTCSLDAVLGWKTPCVRPVQRFSLCGLWWSSVCGPQRSGRGLTRTTGQRCTIYGPWVWVRGPQREGLRGTFQPPATAQICWVSVPAAPPPPPPGVTTDARPAHIRHSPAQIRTDPPRG